MDDESRWERWNRRPYKALAAALIVLGFGARFLPFLGPTARDVVTIVGLPVLIAGVVLLVGPQWHRQRKAMDEEVRRDPTGRNAMTLDERLVTIEHPRPRWAGSAALAVAFGLATAWAIYRAIRTGDSAFVGLAIMLFLPVPVLGWLSWRTRALLRKHP